MEREPNTVYILSLSYGKDSLACIEACKRLGYPLDRIVHAEVWATDTISADLPPMVEFKRRADEIIRERYGIEVEHVCAMKDGKKMTYERMFYQRVRHRPETLEKIAGGEYKTQTRPKVRNGFPIVRSQWCTSTLKQSVLKRISTYNGRVVSETQNRQDPPRVMENSTDFRINRSSRGADNSRKTRSKFSMKGGTDPKINVVQYLGIAADEPERIKRHTKPGIVLPLVDIGWDEAFCRKWCEENDLLSPIYTTATRGGMLVLSQSRRGSTPIIAKEVSRPLESVVKVG